MLQKVLQRWKSKTFLLFATLLYSSLLHSVVLFCSVQFSSVQCSALFCSFALFFTLFLSSILSYLGWFWQLTLRDPVADSRGTLAEEEGVEEKEIEQYPAGLFFPLLERENCFIFNSAAAMSNWQYDAVRDTMVRRNRRRHAGHKCLKNNKSELGNPLFREMR